MNLITNARDALQVTDGVSDGVMVAHRGGTIKIDVCRGAGDPATIEIWVADSGTGIPPQIREKIFDPFFTTKPEGKGTGLGLSISYGIISNHGGSLEVVKSDRHGTTFRVKLPLDA